MSFANLLNSSGVDGDPNFSAGVIGATRGSRGAWPRPSAAQPGIFFIGVNERSQEPPLPGLNAGFMVGKAGQIQPRNAGGPGWTEVYQFLEDEATKAMRAAKFNGGS